MITNAELLEQAKVEKARRLSVVDKEITRRNSESHVSNKVNMRGTTEPIDEGVPLYAKVIDNYAKWGSKALYVNKEIGKGLASSLQAPFEIGSWVVDIYDSEASKDVKTWFDNADAYIENTFHSESTIAKVSETIGRVGAGFVATGGSGAFLNMSSKASKFAYSTLQGGVIDGLFFEGKDGNLADVAKEYGIDNSMVEYFRTKDTDSETDKRFKNFLSGAGIGGAVDTIFGIAKYGKSLLKDASNLKDMTTKDTLDAIEKAIKEDADTFREAQLAKGVDEVDEVTPKVKDTEDLTQDIGAETLSKIDEMFGKGGIGEGTKIAKQADELIKGDIPIPDTSPLNVSKLGEGVEDTFKVGTKEAGDNLSAKPFKQTIKEIDEVIKKKVGDEPYNLMTDMMKTTEKLKNIDVEVGVQRQAVAILAKELDNSVKLAQKTPSVTNGIIVMRNLNNVKQVAKLVKSSQKSIAQALSSFRIPHSDVKLTNALKILDAVDPEVTALKFQRALDEEDYVAYMKFMDELNDTSKTLTQKMNNMTDSLYSKVTNSLSESMIANMLSSISTLSVNVIGNSLVKHQKLIEDATQFIWGNILKTEDRMSRREFVHILGANVGHNFKDIAIIGKNIKEWVKSGIKDEVFDKNVLVKFSQDQDFDKHYISSKYWRGAEKGSQASNFNNMINIYGKLARSPYKTIGFIDDYYKRGAFRAELARIGGRLAFKKGLKGKEFDKFMAGFYKANTELRMINNTKKVPNDAWLKANKDYIGYGDDTMRYMETATDNANMMTFQKDLGEGLLGKSVKFMNSDGLLRIIVPFKLTPINLLKHSVSTATQPIRQLMNRDILEGGIKGDIALAKLTVSSSIMLNITSYIASGRVTGTFSSEERKAMQGAGIPEQSIKQDDGSFIEYKQVEPLATIMSSMADLHRLYTGLSYRLTDASIRDELDSEFKQIGSDLGMILVQNITSKTYTKSLFEALEVANGDKNLIDYTGNLSSNVLPFSSLTNYVGRVTNDGFKKEARSFMERLTKNYRWLLDRDALDAYGRPIKDTEYLYGFTVKTFDDTSFENKGTREVARLGIPMKDMPNRVSYGNVSVKLTIEQHYKMKEQLGKYKLAEKLSKMVNSKRYLKQNDEVRKLILQKVIAKGHEYATKITKADKEVLFQYKKNLDVYIQGIKRGRDDRTTYNDMIIGKVK